MNDSFIEIVINQNQFSEVENLFEKLERKMGNWHQELYDIGVIMLRSEDQTFQEQGRPIPWTPSQAALNRNGQTLMETGRLRRSITVLGNPDNIFFVGSHNLQVGSDVYYGKFLQERWAWLLIQDEDILLIEDVIIRSLQNL